MLRRACAIGFAVWLCAQAHAQDNATGALRGSVHGPDGAPISEAAITLRSADHTAPSRTAITSSDGRYQILALEPGTYEETIARNGFAPLPAVAVTITLGETTVRNADLLASFSQTVTATVNVDAPGFSAPDLFTSPLDKTIRTEEVTALPIDGRRWQDLAVLSPLVAPADEEESRISAAGISAVQNTYTLDGAIDGRCFNGDARGSRRLRLGNAQSGVRELRVIAVSAGDDRTGAGAAFHTITRAPSARRGGTLFVQQRSNLFAAIDPSAVVTRYNNGTPTVEHVKPADTRLQWGATLFGALPRTPLLTHIAYEQESRSFPAVSSPQSANFYALSSTQSALLQTRGVSLAKQKEALQYIDGLSGSVARRADEWSLLPRLDWNIATRASLAFTWSHTSRTSPAGLRSQTVVNRGAASFGDDTISTDALIARWSQTLSTRAINRVLIGFSRDLELQQAQLSLPQEPHTGPNGFSPQVSIGSDFIFGKPSALGRRRYPDERRLQADDAFSYATQHLALQAGAHAVSIDEHISSLSNEEGTYTYLDSTAPGRAGALVDWITDWTFSSSAYPNGGCPAIYAQPHYFCFRSFTQSFGAQSIAFRTGEASTFAQVQWQAARQLVVTAGARYEVFALPHTQQPNAALDALFGDFATTSRLPRDGNNVAPYAAIAWGRGRTVLRLSAGVNYGRIPGATLWSALSRTALPSSTRTVHLTAQTVVDANCASAGFNFGYPSTYVCAPSASTLRTTSAVMFANNFAMPAVAQAQLSVEHQIGAALLSATYTGFTARSLPNSTDVNIAPSTQTASFRITRSDGHGEAGVRNGDNFALPLYTSRVNANFGPVTVIVSNASASHHSLVLAAQRPLRRGWSLRASWTYAKTLDFGQDHSALPLTNGQLDPFNIRYDRAASDLDRRHRLVLAGFYQTRIAGTSMRARLLNEWTLAPLFTASAGRPYSYLIAGGTALSGGGDTINGAGGLRYLPSVGRNTLRLPWSENLNLRLARRLRLNDSLRAQLYADAFNTLNASNVTRVQQRAFLVGEKAGGITSLIYQDAATIAAEGLRTQAFGTRTGAGTLLARQREFQFGIRIEW